MINFSNSSAHFNKCSKVISGSFPPGWNSLKEAEVLTLPLPAGSKELRISNNVMVYDNLPDRSSLAGKHSLLPVDHENCRREIH